MQKGQRESFHGGRPVEAGVATRPLNCHELQRHDMYQTCIQCSSSPAELMTAGDYGSIQWVLQTFDAVERRVAREGLMTGVTLFEGSIN